MTQNGLATIRNAKLPLSLLAAISFIVACASSAMAGITITQSSCPILIAQAGEYDLATDVGPCLDVVDGIDIVASGVTLRLNGHTITGGSPGCNDSAGIHVGSLLFPISQVHVLGPGTVRNFANGFLAQNSAGSSVKFLTAEVQCARSADGLEISAPGSQWKLEGNVVRGGSSSLGIALDRGVDDNDLIRNDVNNGIELVDSSNNIVINNTAHDGFEGITLVGLVIGSNNNEIHSNTTNNNRDSGLAVSFGSSANNITGNTSFNNGLDMEDDNPSCDSNKWKGNQFGTANQSCIH